METGTIEIENQSTVYKLQYEVSNEFDNWFDLKIWLNGRSMSERVPRYTDSLLEDIKAPHAIRFLEELLGQSK